jgi:hypothetical protein
MGEGARIEAIGRFLKKHRKWLTEKAINGVDPSLLARLGAKIKLDTDIGGDGVSVALTWTEEGVKHEQRLEPFSKEYLADADVEEFGNDCDIDFI